MAEAEAARLREEVAALRAAAAAAQRSLDAARLRTSTAETAVHRAQLAAARAEGQASHFKDNDMKYNGIAYKDIATNMMSVCGYVCRRVPMITMLRHGQVEAYERNESHRRW